MMKIDLIRKNEKIIYHTGFLAEDRDPEFSKLKRHEATDLDDFAKKLLQATKIGHGELSQRKIEEDVYAYIFTKK